MPLFADSRKRLDRAVVHAEAVKTIWETLIDPKSYSTAIEMNSDWTEGVVKYCRAAPVPENDLAVEFGEMFYQLRAALDSLIYEASIITEKRAPPSNENRAEFPVCIDSGKFDKSTVNVPPFPKKLRDWIEAIQPYNASKTTGTDLENLGLSLGLLHDCARKDRHRRLHVVGAIPTTLQYQFLSHPGRVVSVHPMEMDLLEGKNEFLAIRTIGFDPKGTGGKIKLNSEVIIEISIDEIPVLYAGDSTRAFNSLFNAVNAVISHFENWFK